MLRFEKFSKSYGSHKVLNIEEDTIPSGIHLLKGINGAGKTTLLQSVAGILDFKGDIIVDGVSLKSHPLKAKKKISYSEAEPQFPPFLSAKEVAAFVARNRGVEKKEVKKLRDILHMKDFFKNPIASYSSGMIKKTSLLLAFLSNPKLILLDEPFTTIDAEAFDMVRNLIEEFHKQGTTFIISAHQLYGAMPLKFDHTYLLKDRSLHQIEN